MSRAGTIPNWGSSRPGDLARREHLRADGARQPDPRSHRRIQVLPPESCLRRSTSTLTAQGLCLPDRDHIRVAGRLPISEVPITFSDREGLEDEQGDRRGSRLEGAAASAPSPHRRLRQAQQASSRAARNLLRSAISRSFCSRSPLVTGSRTLSGPAPSEPPRLATNRPLVTARLPGADHGRAA